MARSRVETGLGGALGGDVVQYLKERLSYNISMISIHCEPVQRNNIINNNVIQTLRCFR